MDPRHPMLDFVGEEVEITGSIIDGRKPHPYASYFYRYPGDPNVYEITFHLVGRDQYVYRSSNDPKARQAALNGILA